MPRRLPVGLIDVAWQRIGRVQNVAGQLAAVNGRTPVRDARARPAPVTRDLNDESQAKDDAKVAGGMGAAGMGAGKGAGKTAPTDTEIVNAVAFDVAGIKIAEMAPVSPQAAAEMVPIYIESGNHPDRKSLADDVRAALGQPTGGDKKAAAAAQYQQRTQQAEQQSMQKASAQADIRGKGAKAGLDLTETDEIKATSHLAAMQHRHHVAMDTTAPEDDPEDQAIRDSLAEAAQPT